jgi:UDP-N-acetylglucosamine 4,6-dehydratase
MKDKRILIIGGTGALGKTLIKKYHQENKIMIFSRDEHKHVDLLKQYPKIKSYLGDIRDKSSITNSFSKFKPQVVINTAALKHVPICEDNAIESVKTNILGHQNLIEVASEFNKLETLIFVSTDKACKPINIYGMCKAISEKLYYNYAESTENTKVVMVRYGNVLESTGSVIPYFKSLIKSGQNYLPITHPEMTRFLLTLDDATDLIDWAYEYEYSHGKIAVPKIKAMKVTDIADCLIEEKVNEKQMSMGYADDGDDTVDVGLKIVGIRPGEKLHEELISKEEWLRTTDHENYLIGTESTNDELWSYNSKDSLMDSSETYKFLQDSGVIQ